MFKNYLKIAFRNLWKQKVFSLIHVTGLAVGMGVSFLILQFVINEFSYDRFHQNGQRIFKLASYIPKEEKRGVNYSFSERLAPYLAETDPSVENYVRITHPGKVVIKNPEHPEKLNTEQNVAFVDASFFSVFTLSIRQGSAANVFSKPLTVAITERTAEKYFGKQDPIGKKLRYSGMLQLFYQDAQLLEVVAVMENPPAHSTLRYEIISSFATGKVLNKDIQDQVCETYLLLNARAAAAKVKSKLTAACEFIPAFNFNKKDKYRLDPLLEMHRDGNEYTAVKIRIFSGIAIAILLLALFNYINLTTARATVRAKEVGIRKTLGVNRISLLGQFFMESVVVIILAFLLAVCLVAVFRDFFNDLFGFSIESSVLASLPFISAVIVIVATAALLAGCYPALVLSGFAPVKVIRGNFGLRYQGINLRRGFIILQFIVSTGLILGSLVIDNQLSFMKAKNPGFNIQQLLTVNLGIKPGNTSQLLKQELKTRYGFQNVSTSNFSFFDFYMMTPYYHPVLKKQALIGAVYADEDFISNMGLSLKVPLDKNRPVDTKGFYLLVNETALKELGLSSADAAGYKLFTDAHTPMGEIAGVVNDFDFFGSRVKNQAMLIMVHNGKNAEPSYTMNYLQLRLNAQELTAQKIALLEKVYKKFEPDWPFQYSFVNDDFNRMFQDDLRFLKMIRLFAGIAIFLACLGLLGMISFATQTRMKEIGIRKILGANVPDLLYLLSADFIRLVLIAIAVALPASWYLTDKWLANFPNRAQVSMWVYVLTGFISVSFALVTISLQSISTLVQNPVNLLRRE